jgi:hypothetical protein
MFEIVVIALMLPGLLFLVGIVSMLLVNHREVHKIQQDSSRRHLRSMWIQPDRKHQRDLPGMRVGDSAVEPAMLSP